MKSVNVHAAKTHLSRLLERVAGGEEIVLSKAGKPVATLSPYKSTTSARRLGFARGKIRMAADFNAPLEDFEAYS